MMCPIRPNIPITDAAAKFVHTAILGSIFNIDIIAGIRILPRTNPTRAPRKPIPNPIIDSKRIDLFLLRLRILLLLAISSNSLLFVLLYLFFLILKPLSSANDSYKIQTRS